LVAACGGQMPPDRSAPAHAQQLAHRSARARVLYLHKSRRPAFCRKSLRAAAHLSVGTSAQICPNEFPCRPPRRPTGPLDPSARPYLTVAPANRSTLGNAQPRELRPRSDTTTSASTDRRQGPHLYKTHGERPARKLRHARDPGQLVKVRRSSTSSSCRAIFGPPEFARRPSPAQRTSRENAPDESPHREGQIRPPRGTRQPRGASGCGRARVSSARQRVPRAGRRTASSRRSRPKSPRPAPQPPPPTDHDAEQLAEQLAADLTRSRRTRPPRAREPAPAGTAPKPRDNPSRAPHCDRKSRADQMHCVALSHPPSG
jgi:hypothetical protein